MDNITPEYVMSLTRATDDYLCPLSANIYGIEFVYFRVRDLESGTVLFEVATEDDAEDVPEEEQVRTIKYHLGPDFLRLKALGSTINFKVGTQEVRNFRMIERHYFRDILLKSFDFTLDFCMPNSTNSWEIIYEMPDLDEELHKQLVDNPWETKSDSFYFADGVLIMHNKAEYNYSPLI